MIKKLTLIIVALSLIVSFGFTNVYADWSPGDPNDWYFLLEAANEDASVWDVSFHAVDDTFLASFFLETQATPTDVGFVSGIYDFAPGGFYQRGFSPISTITDRGDGNIGNIGGWIAGSGHDFEPGESMMIAQLTFDNMVDLDFLWAENMFFTTDINGQLWDIANLLETNDGITAPYFDLHDKGLNANLNTYGQTVPVPAAFWLLGSGILGMVGINRRKKN